MSSGVPSWITYLSALLTPAIGVGVVAIAFLQWQTNKNRLKVELFDRRYQIYRAVKDLIDSIMVEGGVKISEKEANRFVLAVSESQFLFDKELATYIKSISKKAVKMAVLERHLKELPAGERRTEVVSELDKVLGWSINQSGILAEKFSPFLKLKH